MAGVDGNDWDLAASIVDGTADPGISRISPKLAASLRGTMGGIRVAVLPTGDITGADLKEAGGPGRKDVPVAQDKLVL